MTKMRVPGKDPEERGKMKEEQSDSMKLFIDKMKKKQEETGVRIHYMGCGEYDFSQLFPDRGKKNSPTKTKKKSRRNAND